MHHQSKICRLHAGTLSTPSPSPRGRARYNRHMAKYLVAVIVCVAVVAGLAWWLTSTASAPIPPAQPTQKKAAAALAPEVESVLNTKTALFSQLLSEPAVVEAVRASNQKNSSLSQDEIKRLDAEWQAAKSVTPFIAGFMSNDLARTLIAFQKMHPEFREIFVADKIGLNVGQTDKTSDYYQADESWWVNSYNKGTGANTHGNIEFDESSQTEAISIYVPIMDGGTAIGVAKGVINLSDISREL